MAAADAAGGLGGPAATDVPFEEALEELERIVRELERGDLGLDQSLALYERGVALVRACAAQLDAAEARVRVLSIDGDGRPVLAPFEETGA
jgi:exodeoxyribonuclease VII small subunit